MFLYINQQLNVILYTYSFKRNSNQSLELNNPSPRENDFQKIKPNIWTQDLWATKEHTLFHREKGFLYNHSWGQRLRCSHGQSKNNYWSSHLGHFHKESSETQIWPWAEMSINSTRNGAPARVEKCSISEKGLPNFMSYKWAWNA